MKHRNTTNYDFSSNPYLLESFDFRQHRRLRLHILFNTTLLLPRHPLATPLKLSQIQTLALMLRINNHRTCKTALIITIPKIGTKIELDVVHPVTIVTTHRHFKKKSLKKHTQESTLVVYLYSALQNRWFT